MVQERRSPANDFARPPSLGVSIAQSIRDRILTGELGEGDTLPALDELAREYSAGKPTVREALRILQSEGLITVRRGNSGGAIVHEPKLGSAAQTLERVLRARGVDHDDIGDALRHVEPLCAALCAARDDRADTVVPRLRAAHERAVAAVDDASDLEFIDALRHFHEVLVGECGNQTLIVMVGALEAVWSAHERTRAARMAAQAPSTPALRRQSVDEHDDMLRLIVAGDVNGVMTCTQRHLARVQENFWEHHALVRPARDR